MTTSRLTPEPIPLDKGLNLQAAKIIAPVGSVLDSLNYEQVDFLGQKRIDGYVRYDGSIRSDQDVFYGLGGAAGEAFFANGQLVGVGVGNGYTAIIDHTKVPDGATELAHTSSPQEQYNSILQFNQVLRNRVTGLPGPVAGLHWFNDRLYAVASVPYVAGSAMPNQTYLGLPVLHSDGGRVYLGGNIAGAGHGDIASIYQSRSEIQAQTELGNPDLFGWEFVHQGWSVDFRDGISLYGSLPALNLNLGGIGVLGPTPTDGRNGIALSVNQKAPISGRAPQVNGWKAFDTPTSYNISASYLEEADDEYLYADAYVVWDSETGEIDLPGAFDPAIPEYLANATVEVEIP